jgi:hypothetical protein
MGKTSNTHGRNNMSTQFLSVFLNGHLCVHVSITPNVLFQNVSDLINHCQTDRTLASPPISPWYCPSRQSQSRASRVPACKGHSSTLHLLTTLTDYCSWILRFSFTCSQSFLVPSYVRYVYGRSIVRIHLVHFRYHCLHWSARSSGRVVRREPDVSEEKSPPSSGSKNEPS